MTWQLASRYLGRVTERGELREQAMPATEPPLDDEARVKEADFTFNVDYIQGLVLLDAWSALTGLHDPDAFTWEIRRAMSHNAGERDDVRGREIPHCPKLRAYLLPTRYRGGYYAGLLIPAYLTQAVALWTKATGDKSYLPPIRELWKALEPDWRDGLYWYPNHDRLAPQNMQAAVGTGFARMAEVDADAWWMDRALAIRDHLTIRQVRGGRLLWDYWPENLGTHGWDGVADTFVRGALVAEFLAEVDPPTIPYLQRTLTALYVGRGRWSEYIDGTGSPVPLGNGQWAAISPPDLHEILMRHGIGRRARHWGEAIACAIMATKER